MAAALPRCTPRDPPPGVPTSGSPPQPPAFLQNSQNMATREKSLKSTGPKVIANPPPHPFSHPRGAEALPPPQNPPVPPGEISIPATKSPPAAVPGHTAARQG